MLLEYKRWQDDQRDACGDYWKDTAGRVFTGDDGAPVFPDSLTKWFSAFVKRIGLPDVHIHSLRHTYASLMIADGTPLVVISRRLGHAQVSTTANIYSHVIASADEKAAQISEKFADVVAPTVGTQITELTKSGGAQHEQRRSCSRARKKKPPPKGEGLELEAGLEPATYALRVRRSTN